MKINPWSLFTIASALLIGVAIVHASGHFWLTVTASDEEKQLIESMEGYQKRIVGGSMSMADILHGLNVCYALFFLFAGCLNLIIVRNTGDITLLGKVSAVNSVFFICGAAISLYYFYWLPVFSFAVVGVLYFMSGYYFKKGK